ncbi:MAG TPA: hypothetical protein VHV47_14660 [Opitutaceae bacterium]|nr:hypothetical protein [Opitutaceae bacterium]
MRKQGGISVLVYSLPLVASGALAELAYDRPALYSLIFRPRWGWSWWLPNGLHGIVFAGALIIALAHLFRALKWSLPARCAALIVAAATYLALDFFVTISVAGWHGDFM